MSSFESNLKRLRTRQGLKQEELAQKMSVTRQTVSGWETGRRQPDLETLKKLAKVLDVDIHELIYGNKPGEYPQFQKKYVIQTVVLGSIVAIILLFRLLIWPYFKVLCSTKHWGLALMISYAIMRQGCSFAMGALIPAVIRLYLPGKMDKKQAICCLIGGILATLFIFMLWLGMGVWSRWIVYPIGIAFLSYILPFVSGLCISTGSTWK